MLNIRVLKKRLEKRAYKAFFRQLKYDVMSTLWGSRCPLCNCKDLGRVYSKPYLPFKICQGCNYDLSLARDGMHLDSRALAKVLKITGYTYEEFCQRDGKRLVTLKK